MAVKRAAYVLRLTLLPFAASHPAGAVLMANAITAPAGVLSSAVRATVGAAVELSFAGVTVSPLTQLYPAVTVAMIVLLSV
jgi:hypothetical protein